MSASVGHPIDVKIAFAVRTTILATIFLTGFFSARLNARAGDIPRIGIVSRSPAISKLEDLLVVTLSKRSDLALLEREHIHRLLSEQATLTSQVGDFIKVGEILGADGLLVLEKFERAEKSFVSTRLIAVKPGVVLDLSEYSFPIQGEADWSKLFVERLDTLFPKLAVLPKDAVPISILALRSATKSAEGEALERNLNSLLSRRLTQQKEVFVLERSSLQLAVDEKSWKGLAESEFWKGSYLLEGVIDQGGFDPSSLTINLRLNPPGSAKPVEFEIKEKRSDLVAAIDQLAMRLISVLKPGVVLAEWSAEAEAARYFGEAKWSLRWNMLPETLAAADTAWALGRQDSTCAVMRVECASKLAITIPPNYGGKRIYDPMSRSYVPLTADARLIGFARRSLSAFLEFSVTRQTNNDPVILWSWSRSWHSFGEEALESASQVLQLFHHFPEAQPAVANQLGELRELAQATSKWLLRLPSVRNFYWPSKPGDRDSDYSLLNHPNVFRSAINYGWVWHDHPEETIALYRELMTTPLFYAIHQEFCVRAPERPRLAVWNGQDRQRVSSIWEEFVNELRSSTNQHYRLEAKFLQLVDEPAESVRAQIFSDLATIVCELDSSILSNNASLLAMQRGAETLATSELRTPDNKRAWLYRPWAARARRLQDIEDALVFEEQKQFLQRNAPYQQYEFAVMFNRHLNYSKFEATELAPMVQNYWSNIMVTASSRTDSRNWTNSALQDLRQLESRIGLGLGISSYDLPTRTLDAMIEGGIAKFRSTMFQFSSPVATSPPPVTPVQKVAPKSNPSTNTTSPITAAQPPSRDATLQKITGTAFHPIPHLLLKAAGITNYAVNAHRISDNRLWLNLRYGGYLSDWRNAIAVWDPSLDKWELIPNPTEGGINQSFKLPANTDQGANGGLYFESFDGYLYVSPQNESLRKFDLKARRWNKMESPVIKPTQLFKIHGRLYGANEEAIFEILNEGRATHLLAACRRRPAASRLDSLNSLEGAKLLPGPNKSIRVCVGQNVFLWNGEDWEEPVTIRCAERPYVFEDATLFRSSAALWLLPHDQRDIQPFTQEHEGEAKFPLKPTTAVGILNSNLFFVSPQFLNSNVSVEVGFVNLASRKTMKIQVKLADDFDHYTGDSSRLGRLRPWIEFAGETLILGHGRWSGVWTISRSELEALLTVENERINRSK